MRYRLLWLCAAFIASMMLVVVVGWGAMVLDPPKHSVDSAYHREAMDDPQAFIRQYVRDVPIDDCVCGGNTYAATGWRELSAACFPDANADRITASVTVREAGWPFAAVAGYVEERGEAKREVGFVTAPGWLRDAARGRLEQLPVMPQWRGLIGNGLLYACAFTVIVFVPVMIRRVQRRRRGLCAHCGYDLRGSAGASGAGPAKCPECGHQVAAGAKYAS